MTPHRPVPPSAVGPLQRGATKLKFRHGTIDWLWFAGREAFMIVPHKVDGNRPWVRIAPLWLMVAKDNPAQPQPVPHGRWQCVELMVKMNSAPDKADGELALWLDGKLAMHVLKGIPRGPWSGMGFDLLTTAGEPFEGLRLRTDDALKINHLWLEHYVDEGAQRENRLENPTRVNRVWFDDMVVSREYVGPIQK